MEKKVFQNIKSSVDCPVDLVKVDETRVRVVAFFVLVITCWYVLTGAPLLIGLLLVDFVLRALNLNNFSPLALLAGSIVKQAGLKSRPVDRAPKRFAAFVGIVFLTAILIACVIHQVGFSRILAGVIIIFASLESFAGFCAGCYVYAFINRFKS